MMAKRPIHSIKHVVTIQEAISAGGVGTNELILAKDAPVLANVNEVETGSTVSSFFLSVEAVRTTATSGVLSNVYLVIYKNPGGNLTAITPNTQGANDSKRYVIHSEMIMLEQQGNGNPRSIFKGVLSIPKGFRRFGPNDSLTMRVQSPGVNINACFQCIYKEYR